ncbi:15860_t:CDS:10 [Entrophospora sp. SA101]|nr:15860_t:CDS:10 [Entrophospora sp. SA101]
MNRQILSSSSWFNEIEFSKLVTELCHQKYKLINKSKSSSVQNYNNNNNKEWTVLAGIVSCTVRVIGEYDLSCVSIGSGLKCLSQNKLSKNGDLIHDSHAEVLAKRAFIINELELALSSQSEYFIMNDQLSQEKKKNKFKPLFKFKDSSLTFHMYIKDQMIQVKLGKDGFRRGRMDYKSIGVLRTKPGRADSEPTLSMSCSDKLAQWNVVGLQSSLLSELISPIYLSTIIIGDLFSKQSLERALFERIQGLQSLPYPYSCNIPKIIQSTQEFDESFNYISNQFPQGKIVTSNIAKVWLKGPSNNIEFLVNGRKQGASKSKLSSKTRSLVSKLSLFKSIVELLSKIPSDLVSDDLRITKEISYREFKSINKDYQLAKKCLREQIFKDIVELLSKIPSDLVSDDLRITKEISYREFKSINKDYQLAKKCLREQIFKEWIKCPSEIYENFSI